jgi:general secretion pathway protein D
MNRLTHWGIPLALAAFSIQASTHNAYAQSAKKFFKEGRAAEAADDVEGAFEDYAKAFQKKPDNEDYKVSYQRVRIAAASSHVLRGERLRDQGDNTGALTEFLRALEIDPSDELATQDIRVTRVKMDGEAKTPDPDVAMSSAERTQLLDLGGPPQLEPTSTEPLTFHATEDVKDLYEAIGKTAGINVLFDPSYHSTRLKFDVANVDVYTALRILGLSSDTFWRPVTKNTIFIAENSREKRTELAEQAVQTFYLTNVSQQGDLNDVQTTLRNVFGNEAKVFTVQSQNAIVVRGTPDELLLASKLINDLDKARPEVVVDVEVLEVDRNLMRTIGLQLPQTLSVNFQQADTSSTSTSTSSLTVNNLAHLNSNNFAVSIGSAAVNLLLSDSRTRIVQNPQLRASDGQESSVNIGERLPVAEGSYSAGVASAVSSPLVNTQFQYLDVGVGVDVTPVVHYDGDVSMKLKIDVSASTSTEDLGGIDEPIITQRKTAQTIRLRNGQSTLLTGILQQQKGVSISGYPGLSELPILKYVFGSRAYTDNDTEIVFLLTPHIVRAVSLSPLNLRPIDTGTLNDIQLNHVQQPDSTAASQAVGAPTGIPNLGAPGAQIPEATNPARMQGAIPGQVLQPPATIQATNSAAPPAPTQAAAGGPRFQLLASNATQSVGNTFQEKVMITGAQDAFAVPLQVQYDHSRLELVNVDEGEFLGRDGQPVALAHRDENGTVPISISRPPGAVGISGSGVVCTLTFQAKAPGDANISIVQPEIRNSKQQAVQATGTQGVVHIQ